MFSSIKSQYKNVVIMRHSVPVLHVRCNPSQCYTSFFHRQLQENVNSMLWLTKQSTCSLYLFYYTRTLRRDALQPPTMKNVVFPTRKNSFPTPIALLIRKNTATCAAFRWR